MIFIAILLMMAIEYVGHRWFMHRFVWPLWGTYKRHAIDHHRDGRLDTNIDLPVWYTLLLASPLLLLLYFISFSLCFWFTIVLICYSLLWTHIHRRIHFEKDVLPSHYYKRNIVYRIGDKIYDIIRKHHEMHHLRPNTNFAVLFVVTDYIFGSKA